MIPAFWLSVVEYFSMFCVDPSVHPRGRKAGVWDAPGAEGWPNIPCRASSFGIKSRELSQTALLGQVLLFGDRAVTSGDLTLALPWPGLGKFALSLMDFGV